MRESSCDLYEYGCICHVYSRRCIRIGMDVVFRMICKRIRLRRMNWRRGRSVSFIFFKYRVSMSLTIPKFNKSQNIVTHFCILFVSGYSTASRVYLIRTFVYVYYNMRITLYAISDFISYATQLLFMYQALVWTYVIGHNSRRHERAETVLLIDRSSETTMYNMRLLQICINDTIAFVGASLHVVHK